MLNKMRKMNKKNGFTLIELVAVITILIILMAIAVPKVRGFQDQSRIAADKTSIHTINNAIALHCACNNYSDLVGLTSMNVVVPLKNGDSVTVVVKFLQDKGLLEPSATIYFPQGHNYSVADNKIN